MQTYCVFLCSAFPHQLCCSTCCPSEKKPAHLLMGLWKTTEQNAYEIWHIWIIPLLLSQQSSVYAIWYRFFMNSLASKSYNILCRAELNNTHFNHQTHEIGTKMAFPAFGQCVGITHHAQLILFIKIEWKCVTQFASVEVKHFRCKMKCKINDYKRKWK